MDVVTYLKDMQCSKMFNLWYILCDERTTASVDIQNVDFCAALLSHLKTTDIFITHLSIWNLEKEMSILLKLLKKSLIFLEVFAQESRENDILKYICKSGVQLENFRFIDPIELKLSAQNIQTFLQTQSESLVNLDLSQWLGFVDQKEIEDIFEQIFKMKKLKELHVDARDLVDENSEKFYRLKYFNIDGLMLQIKSKRGIDHNVRKLNYFYDTIVPNAKSFSKFKKIYTYCHDL